jgi:hypothetical protein
LIEYVNCSWYRWFFAVTVITALRNCPIALGHSALAGYMADGMFGLASVIRNVFRINV